jgi:SAM-dependent methyltransferase
MKDKNYNEWHADHNLPDNDINTPWHNFVNGVLNTKLVNDKIILEIGCGRGGFSRHLIQKYPGLSKLFACDYSETALQIARQAQAPGKQLCWQKEDIQALSFSAAYFDLVISCETIEHIPDPHRALEEIFRVLKPGGVFILTCPSYFNLFGLWCLYRKVIGKPYTEGGQPYVNYIQFPSIFGKLKSLGFEVKHFHSSEFVIPWWVPKTFWYTKVPSLLSVFGSRTFYVLEKIDHAT